MRTALVTGQVLLAIASAVAWGACGGDAEEDAARDSGPGSTVATTAERSGPGGGRREGRADSRPGRGERKASRNGPTTGKRRPRDRPEALRRLPPRLRAKVVRYYTRVVLAAFDLKATRISVSYGGAEVTVILTRRTACRAHSDEADRILRGLRDAVPYPRTVTVRVAGTDESLGAYLARCERQSLPGSRGRVVFSKSGSRLHRTGPFRISSKHWTVEYTNTGSFFQVFVFKGKQGQQNPISRRKPGSGKRTYRTGPGKFKLYISGSRDWTVRVRDGG